MVPCRFPEIPMSEQDRSDQPPSTQEQGEPKALPAPASPQFEEPSALTENPTEALNAVEHLRNGQVEDVGEILSDRDAMRLIGDVDRNGTDSEPISSQTAEPEANPSAPMAEPGGASLLDAVRVLGDQVNSRLEVIQAMVEREIRAEMTRERVVDRLHAELQEYKQDLLLKVMRPIFVDLIQLHDDIGKMEEARQSSGDGDDGENARVQVLLESIRSGIEDILYRQGVEPFEEEQGSFDARRQRAVTTVPTESPELNKTVAARLRKGFQSGDKVIRPEIVSVYTLKK
jgi:molecular chaperone GrpE